MTEENSKQKSPLMTRRRFMALGGAMAVVGAGVAVASAHIIRNDESQHIVVDTVQIPVKNLGAELEGFTIAVLADFHLYPLTKIELIHQAVAIANNLQPDLTVILGDYVWHEVEAIWDLAPALAGLNAKHGVFSIIGNHDIWTDIDIVTAGLTKSGLEILKNEGFPITVGKSSFYLAALDDGWSGNPDINAAMANWSEGQPTVLLLHEPDLADTYSKDKRIVLQLSGHSHAGQIRFPRVGALILPYLGWKYDMGLYNVNDMWLYTNRGIGVTNEPIRYNCPPEVTEIKLVRA